MNNTHEQACMNNAHEQACEQTFTNIQKMFKSALAEHSPCVGIRMDLAPADGLTPGWPQML